MVNYKKKLYNFQKKSIKSWTVFTSSKFEVTFKVAYQLQNLQFTSSVITTMPICLFVVWVDGKILTGVNGMDTLISV